MTEIDSIQNITLPVNYHAETTGDVAKKMQLRANTIILEQDTESPAVNMRKQSAQSRHNHVPEALDISTGAPALPPPLPGAGKGIDSVFSAALAGIYNAMRDLEEMMNKLAEDFRREQGILALAEIDAAKSKAQSELEAGEARAKAQIAMAGEAGASMGLGIVQGVGTGISAVSAGPGAEASIGTKKAEMDKQIAKIGMKANDVQDKITGLPGRNLLEQQVESLTQLQQANQASAQQLTELQQKSDQLKDLNKLERKFNGLNEQIHHLQTQKRLADATRASEMASLLANHPAKLTTDIINNVGTHTAKLGSSIVQAQASVEEAQKNADATRFQAAMDLNASRLRTQESITQENLEMIKQILQTISDISAKLSSFRMA